MIRAKPPYVPEDLLSYLTSKLNGMNTQEEHEGVTEELHRTTDRLVNHALSDGFQTAPMHEVALRLNARIYSEKSAMDERIRFAQAMQYDITEILHRHIAERRRYDGNVVLEFAGPTGSGKSSCMLGLMERHNGLREAIQRQGPEAVRRRLSIDLQDLSTKLEGLTRGDAVCMDEQLHLVGEGAETALKLMRNLEDTLRGTGIDIYYASPGARDNHDASQGILQSIAWSPAILRDGERGRGATRFLYSVSLLGGFPIPLGTVTLPWCSPETYAAYKPIKQDQLARTLRGQFHHDGRAFEHIVRQLFTNGDVLARIRIKGRPSRQDLRRYIIRFARSLSTSELDNLVNEIEEMMDILRDAPTQFETLYGWKAPEAMEQIARFGKPQGDGGGITSIE